MATNIFLTGATGYIGGSVLYTLLTRSDAENYKFSALTRSKDKAQALEEIGVRAVIGSHDDLELIERECRDADMVISLADADDLEVVKAMLSGMKKRREETGRATPFIHTSGTGVIVVDGKGRAPTKEDPVYDDADADQLEKLPDDAPHRVVDLAILAADKAGDCVSYIVLPSTIYGIATGNLGKGSNKGKIMNRHSQQMPAAIRAALRRGGVPGVYGEGRNVWPHVHIDDLMDLYTIVFDLAKDGKGDHGREGFYFGINGHYEYKKAAEAIGRALEKRGRSKSTTPTPFTQEELKGSFGEAGWYVGSIGQGEANRARKFGWKPKHGTDDFYASLDEEVEAQIALMESGGK